MKIAELLKEKVSYSFEFFPPKTEAASSELEKQVGELADLKPSYVSVTCGAGGSTRNRTEELVLKLNQELGIPAVPHLTCVGQTRSDLRTSIEQYRDSGVKNILALRGDPPKGESAFIPPKDGLSYAAELVSLIREIGDFGIGVAGYPEGHPETSDKLKDLDYLKQKVDAGADLIITQLFFDNRDFYDFKERCEIVGINVPIIAGIMPILSRKGVERMCGMCGSRVPADLLKKIYNAPNDDLRKIGVDWAVEQCVDLLKNKVDGIHFYTLNKSQATRHIFEQL
ncbi:MAG: methylenetetrahydrofolate reductase [NAD(P)H] [Lentisphaeria bacterium]|nr:methylenetetrahydrofolate reductase [NAD(P)H] [Lentisphaeria bacterium]NQZ68537.1 methylenetetrahydrofolate reductase [NAD(P)H] [Lentisphaeria bacterium]